MKNFALFSKGYLSNVCFLLADCYLWKQYLIEGGKDDSVIASNQAEKGKLMPIQIKSSTNAAASYIAFFL